MVGVRYVRSFVVAQAQMGHVCYMEKLGSGVLNVLKWCLYSVEWNGGMEWWKRERLRSLSSFCDDL